MALALSFVHTRLHIINAHAEQLPVNVCVFGYDGSYIIRVSAHNMLKISLSIVTIIFPVRADPERTD